MKNLWISVLILFVPGCAVMDKFGIHIPTDGLVAVKNAGFEKDQMGPDHDPSSWHFGLHDWTGHRAGVVNPHDQMYAGGQAPEGTNVGFVSKAGANLNQTLKERLAPNRDYELRVWVGNRADMVEGNRALNYRVELFAGGKLLAVDNNSLSIALGEFRESVVRYASPASDPAIGQPLKINLKIVRGQQVNFDHIRLSSWPMGSGKLRQTATKSVATGSIASPSLTTGNASTSAVKSDGSSHVSLSKAGTGSLATSVPVKTYSLSNLNNSYWFAQIVPINAEVPVDPTLKELWGKGAYLHLRKDGQMGYNWSTPNGYLYDPTHKWKNNGSKLTLIFGAISYTFDTNPVKQTLTTHSDNIPIYRMTMQAKSKGQK